MDIRGLLFVFYVILFNFYLVDYKTAENAVGFSFVHIEWPLAMTVANGFDLQ